MKYGYHRETFLNDSEDLTEGQEKVVEASSEGVRPKMPTQVQNSEVREGRQVKETPDQAVLSPGQAAGGTQAEGECQSSVPEDPKGPLAVKEARLRLWIAEEAGIEVSYPLTLMVDNAAGESFCKSTSGLSKLRGVYQMRDSRIKELRDAKIVTAQHVDTKLNLADRLTKGLSHAARQALDQEMDEVRRSLLVRAGGL